MYRPIILPVVLYGYETWSLTPRENRLLRRIFGSEREEVAGGWRRLHNEELHNLYSRNIILIIKSMIRWADHVARMRDEK
jgi:hypothetical protein